LQEEDFKDQHHVGWDVMVGDVDRVDIIVLRGRVRLMAGELDIIYTSYVMCFFWFMLF
jgi:hypothetical protein